jgi:hypothetical protein
MIVSGDRYVAALGGGLPIEALPLAAFTGALALTTILWTSPQLARLPAPDSC